MCCSLSNLPTRAWPRRLIEDLTHGELHGHGRLDDPRSRQFGWHSDRFQLGHEIVMPLPTAIPPGLRHPRDGRNPALQLAGNMIGWARTGDRDHPVLSEIVDRLAGEGLGQKNRHDVTVRRDTDAPGARAFRHERGIARADHH